MALYAFRDRVKDTTTTTGSGGVLTLAGSPPAGFVSFSQAYAATNTKNVPYAVIGAGNEWEVSIGTFNGNLTLTRTQVLSSSNNGLPVNFSAGNKDVYVDFPASLMGDQAAADFLASQQKVNGLVRNGSFQDGTNAGFSQLVFGNINPPPNIRGYVTATGFTFAIMDDFLPIDTSLIYRLSASCRQSSRSANTLLYLGLIQYDAEPSPNIIETYHCSYVQGSKTTLAAPLSVGDTTVTLTSSANWNNSAAWYFKGISFYNYKNSLGFVYDHTKNPYTRNVFRPVNIGAWNNGGISGNVITLSQAFNLPNPAAGSGGVWPIGTVVANTNDGGSLNYVLTAGASLTIPADWVNFSAYFGGGIDALGAQDLTRFRAGIASCKFFGLLNLSGISTDTLDITSIRITPTDFTRTMVGLL